MYERAIKAQFLPDLAAGAADPKGKAPPKGKDPKKGGEEEKEEVLFYEEEHKGAI